jgi:hypothetical protein
LPLIVGRFAARQARLTLVARGLAARQAGLTLQPRRIPARQAGVTLQPRRIPARQPGLTLQPRRIPARQPGLTLDTGNARLHLTRRGTRRCGCHVAGGLRCACMPAETACHRRTMRRLRYEPAGTPAVLRSGR